MWRCKAWLDGFWRWYRKYNVFAVLQTVYETHLTPAGKALFLLMILSIFLGMVGTDVLLYILMISLTALWCTSLIQAFLYRPRGLEVIPHLQGPAMFNADTELCLGLQYHGQRPLFHLSFELLLYTPQQSLLVLPASQNCDALVPGKQIRLSFPCRLPYRGKYLFHQLVVISHFPFGLFRWRSYLRLKGQQLVYPEYRILEYVQMGLIRKYQSGGHVLTAQLGEALEFRGIRQFMEGDTPRQIYWPALAKTDQLMVREYQEEFFIRLGVILDTQIAEPHASDPGLEAGISLVASIAEWIARQEFLIDIFAAGDQIYHFPQGTARTRLEYLLEILASLQGSRHLDFLRLQGLLQNYSREMSAMVLILLRWDTARAALVRMLQEEGLVLKVLLIQSESGESPDLPGIQILTPEAWRSVSL